MTGDSAHKPTQQLGYTLQLDHTAIHRLSTLVDPTCPAPRTPADAIGVLHLIESLLVADAVQVVRYPMDPVQKETDRLVRKIHGLKAADGTPLVRTVKSAPTLDRKAATSAAEQLYLRLGSGFGKARDPVVAPINAGAGRPFNVRYGTADFWKTATECSWTAQEICDEASARLKASHTAFIFPYGLAHYGPARDQIITSLRQQQAWPETYWQQLEVVFRALYNGILAGQREAAYAPAPERARLIDRLYSRSLLRLREILQGLLKQKHPEFLDREEWLHGFLGDWPAPLPLLGLAALPLASHTTSPQRLVDRISSLRSEDGMVALRKSLIELDYSYQNSESERAKNIERECRAIHDEIAARLGLPLQDLEPRFRHDCDGLHCVEPSTLQSESELLYWLDSRRKNRMLRTTFLSDLIARCDSVPSLAAAIREITRNRGRRAGERAQSSLAQRSMRPTDTRPPRTESRTSSAEEARKLDELRGTFELLQAQENKQARGVQFEGFLAQLSESFNVPAIRSFQRRGEQIDGAVWLDGRLFLIEAKWKRDKSDPEELDHFRAKVDKRVSVDGLFIAIAGFTEGAVHGETDSRQARLLLVDGKDLEAILTGRIGWDALLRAKLCARAFDLRVFVSAEEILNDPELLRFSAAVARPSAPRPNIPCEEDAPSSPLHRVTNRLPAVSSADCDRTANRQQRTPSRHVHATKGATSTIDDILQTGVIRVGCIHQPPLLDHVKGGEGITRAHGLYASLTEHLAQDNGLRVEYIPLRFHEMVQAVVTRDVDIVPCTFPTDERLARVSFAAIMHTLGLAVLASTRTARDLCEDHLSNTHVCIAVTEGEVGWEYARKCLGLHKHPHRFKVADDRRISNCLQLVLEGEADAALADALSCRRFVEEQAHRSAEIRTIALKDHRCTFPVGVMHRRNDTEMSSWLNSRYHCARQRPTVACEEERILEHYVDVIRRVEIQ